MAINLLYNTKNKSNNQKKTLKTKDFHKNIEKKVYLLFNKKYFKIFSYYNQYIINNIIYNEKSHVVAIFKDYLINDDPGDFLRRFYKKVESVSRLPKIYEYYELCSKIFPNYSALPESKYLYQNIQKKQKMIDVIEKFELNGKIRKGELYESEKEYEHEVLNTEIINSILNGTNCEGMEIIFDVNKNNLKQEEINFNANINELVKKINECEYQNLINKSSNNNFFTKINVNKKITNSKIQKKTIENKNQKIIQNLNYTTANNSNIFDFNNKNSIISKFFKVSPNKKKSLLNLRNNLKKLKNNSEIMSNCKIGKNLMEKIEKNLIKMKQNSLSSQKNLSQNLSTTNQTQRDVSSTSRKKMQSNNYLPKNNYSRFNNSNNFIQSLKSHNFNYSKKESSLSNSKRNHNSKKITNMKQNIYIMSDTTSRNKYSKNKKYSHKSKFTLIGDMYSNCSCQNIRDKNSIIKFKKYNKNEYSSKNINTVRETKIRTNKNYSIRLKISGSKNKNNKKKFKNISQPKTKKKFSKKYISRNESELKFVFNITNIKNQMNIKVNTENYSNLLNPTKNLPMNNNIISKNSKNSFICQTQRKNYKY